VRAALSALRLTAGKVPKTKPLRMWAGFGSGRPCDGCSETILGFDIEHEYDLVDGGVLRFHAVCSVLWERMVRS
jgi:hypothetical protein